MQDARLRLDGWREAERRHDCLTPGSPEWQEAEEEVRGAAKLFRPEVAQASVQYAEEDFQDRRPWLSATPSSSPSPRRQEAS